MFSYETRIGILTVVAIVMLIWGYKFLKGKNILSSSTILYAEYNHIDGLSVSDPIFYKGFQIGFVGKVERNNKKNNLLVTLDINDEEAIPKDAVAYITTTGFMGGRSIEMEFKNPCSANTCAKSGDYIKGRTKNMLASMVGTPDDVGIYLDEFKNRLGEIVDTLQANLVGEGGEANQSIENIKIILDNMKNTTGQLDGMMKRSSGNIERMLNDVQAITSNLKSSNEDIKKIISNTSDISTELKESKIIEKTSQKANAAMDEATAAIQNLKTTLASADVTMKKINTLLEKANKNDNTLGLLLNEKGLYEELNKTLKNADLLLQDIRLHPERYRRILSKKEMPYEAPKNDPAQSGN